jgi:hypothetical protein
VDEDKMKKQLLVIGDSFMYPDVDYPGQHWSEMLPEYNVLMRSESGGTNTIIARNFFQGLTQTPDAVVIGFTMNDRVEFNDNDEWVSSSFRQRLTSDQKLTADYYRATADEDINLFKSCVIARSLFLTCEKLNIPYAYSLNQLFNNIAKLPYPANPIVVDILGEFGDRMCATNLATYSDFKVSPGFHTDDPAWQKRFAAEVIEILNKPLT